MKISHNPMTQINQILFGTTLYLQHELNRWKVFKKKHPWLVLSLNVALLLGLLNMLLVAVFLSSVAWGAFGQLPNRAELSNLSNNTATEVYAQDGSLLGRYYFENRSPIKYENISPYFINALIATEDARFFRHEGIDFRSWVRVAVKTILLKDKSSGGGSTITQQLAKNIYPRQSYPFASIYINKLKEVFVSKKLEAMYSKEKILELYLNTVPFSENTYGIKVAANHFFNTSPAELNANQSATLVAMLKATSTYNPVSNPEKSIQRRNFVLGQMNRYGYLSMETTDSLIQKPLSLNYSPLNNNEGIATYFREHLRMELKEKIKEVRKPGGMSYNIYTDGLKVFTSIDPVMQRYAEQAVEDHISSLQKDFEKSLEVQGVEPWETDTVLLLSKWQSNRYRSLVANGVSETAIDSIFEIPLEMKIFTWDGREQTKKMSPMDSIKHYLSLLNAGLLAVDPQTGQVKAWVGGIDHKYFKYDHVKSKRQVGSTFKPIVYTKAIQSGIPPCRRISNHLRRYWKYEGWMPRNADNKYGGMYSMEGGLIHSVNTVTVQLAMRSRPKAVAELAQDLGISGEVPGVPAIALGAVEASLEDMVTVYSTFANRGLRPELNYISRIETKDGKVLVDYESQIDTCEWQRVLTHNEADAITSMLKAAVDRGTGRRLRFRYKFENELAGKTGTSQNHSDGWFMAFNPKLVTGVWVGADSPAVRFRDLRMGQGANTALPVFALFLDQLNKNDHYATVTNATFPEPSQEVKDMLDCTNIAWPVQVIDSLGTPPIPLAPAPAKTPLILTSTKAVTPLPVVEESSGTQNNF